MPRNREACRKGFCTGSRLFYRSTRLSRYNDLVDGDRSSFILWRVFLSVQRGLEKITKVMMLCLLALIVVLAVHSITLDGAMEGVKFYLVPDFSAMKELGIGNVIFGALSQAFFTLSIGAGSMTIFGSYLSKDRSLLGESLHITILDTL